MDFDNMDDPADKPDSSGEYYGWREFFRDLTPIKWLRLSVILLVVLATVGVLMAFVMVTVSR